MPTTTTGVIAADANEGIAAGTSLNATQFFNSVSSISPSAVWLRFTGITIPQGSTINSATLKTYQVGGATGLKFVADSRPAPGNPAAAAQVHTPANVEGTVSPTWSLITGSASSKGAYDLVNVDVQSLVQNLVTNNGYSNGEMVFYIQDNLNSAQYIYARVWGTATTSLGGMPKSASLVINFTLAIPPPDKTTFHHG